VRGGAPVPVTGDACVKRRRDGQPRAACVQQRSTGVTGGPYSSDVRLRGLAERGVVVPRHHVLPDPGWRDLS
jgi:hypothetical protein